MGPDELERRRVDLLECFVPGLLKLVITGVSEGIGSVVLDTRVLARRSPTQLSGAGWSRSEGDGSLRQAIRERAAVAEPLPLSELSMRPYFEGTAPR